MVDASLLALGAGKNYKSMEEKLLGLFHMIANKVRASARRTTVL